MLGLVRRRQQQLRLHFSLRIRFNISHWCNMKQTEMGTNGYYEIFAFLITHVKRLINTVFNNCLISYLKNESKCS